MYDDILLFIKLIEVGSFSKLSNITGVAQSTISRRIANLEEEFKTELIIRTTNNFRISNAGTFLYEKFKNHKLYLENTISEVRQNYGLDTKGILRIALPVLLSKNIIAPYLGQFLEEFPDIDLILSYRSSYIDLIEEGFDAAVTTYEPTAKSYKVILLKKFYIQLYATPEYLASNGPIDTLDIAINKSTVGFLNVDGSYTNDFVAVNTITGETKNGAIPHPRIYIDNLINAYELASSHKMMITAWDSLLENELATGKLIKILPEYYFREIACYLVLPSHTLTHPQKSFVNFIKDCYARIID